MTSSSVDSRKARAAFRLGVAFVASVMVLAFMTALGMAVNVTIGTIVMSTLVFLANSPLRLGALTRWNASDLSLLAFMLCALTAIAFSIERVGTLPTSYVLHAVALIFLCPMAYLFGSTLTSFAGSADLRTVFHLALALVTGFLLLMFLAPELVSDDEMVRGSYYQYAGDCLAIVGLIHLATRARVVPIWPALFVIPILIVVGSRASVAAYGAALLFSGLMPWLVLTFVLIYVGWPWLEALIGLVLPELIDASRVVTSVAGALLEGREDASLLERQQFQLRAIETIKDHPLLGNFGYDYLWNGYVGGFSHSALDLWAQYGAPTFLAFASAVVAAPLMTLLWPQRRAAGRVATLRLLPLLVFLVAEFTFFRHPESVVLFFGIGALSGLSGSAVARVTPRGRAAASDHLAARTGP